MSRMIDCVVLKKPAPGLNEPPYPGELGQRIYDQVSAEAWQQWLERLVIIVNETQINSSEPRALKIVEQHMVGFLFNEGDEGQMPSGYMPQ